MQDVFWGEGKNSEMEVGREGVEVVKVGDGELRLWEEKELVE